MALKSLINSRHWALDGALGTELENAIPADSPFQPKLSRLWSGMVLLHQPALVKKVHRDYLNAGAELLLTSTYQALELSLQWYAGLTTLEIEQLWDNAVDVCVDAVTDHVKAGGLPTPIIGSLGPYGTLLANGSEYTGDYGDASKQHIENYYRGLVHFYQTSPKIDTVFFETVPNFSEVKVIFNMMAKLVATAPLEFLVSFSIRDAETLVDGTPLYKVVRYIEQKLACVPALKRNFLGLGLNCIDYKMVGPAIQLLNKALSTSIPLAVYPNFEFYYKSDKKGSKMLDEWEKEVKGWFSVPNVRIVGGCCGTTPEDIAIVRKVLDALINP